MKTCVGRAAQRANRERAKRVSWVGVVGLLALVACSSGSDGSSPGPINLQGDGGARSLDPARVLRGEVTVLGQTPAGASTPRTFSGPPNSTLSGSDLVRCAYAAQGSRSASSTLLPPNLTIAAGLVGQAKAQAQATVFGVDRFAPFSGHITFDKNVQNPLSLVVRLNQASASSFEEYSYDFDPAGTSPSSSSCTVDITAFTAEHAVGQIACENLFATSASRNASPAGTPQPTASATMAFDCPVQLVDADGQPVSAGSGGGGNGGGGNSGAGGSSASASGGRGGASTSSGGHGGTSTTMPSVLGTACEADADCPGTLSCHHSTDYVADRQCSASCDSSEQCVAKFGAESMCIGAHICVRTCGSSAVCPAKSRCNDNGWCERSGPGSGVPYCSGYATPCSLLTSLQCITADGCSDDSRCGGVASSCYSQFDSYSCSSQQGCYWSTSSKSCSGSARSCSSMLGSGTCALQEGCYWTGGCNGTRAACEDQYPSLCADQPGCTLKTD